MSTENKMVNTDTYRPTHKKANQEKKKTDKNE